MDLQRCVSKKLGQEQQKTWKVVESSKNTCLVEHSTGKQVQFNQMMSGLIVSWYGYEKGIFKGLSCSQARTGKVLPLY